MLSCMKILRSLNKSLGVGTCCRWLGPIFIILAGAGLANGAPRNEAATQTQTQSDTAPRLFQLIEEQNFQELRRYLVEGGETNLRRKDDGWTPLLVAVTRNNVALAALLLQHGADPNARTQDIYQDPILHYALNGEDNQDMIAMLLAAGADPNALSGNKQNTALMKAVTLERLDVVRLMLQYNADVTARALNGGTALLRARNAKNRQLRELIETEWRKARDKANAQRKPMKLNDPERALFAALQTGDSRRALDLLQAHETGINPNAASSNRVSLLMLASYKGMPRVARLLLDRGANVHAGEDPPVLFFALKPENAAEIVELLLEYGADPNARRARDERTILMESVAKNLPELAKMLLAAGARPDYTDKTGAMALDFVKNDAGVDWGKLFLPYLDAPAGKITPAGPVNALATSSQPAADADLYAGKNLEPNKHRLELHLAVVQGDHIQLKQLLADGADVFCYSGRGRTALMTAAEMLDLQACRMLLMAGAEVNQLSRDDYKAPAIVYAASRKNSLPVIKLLHRQGAQLNVRMGSFGYTPLMLASALGEVETVRYLLANGAKADVLAPDGSSAARLAERGGHETIRKLVESAAATER